MSTQRRHVVVEGKPFTLRIKRLPDANSRRLSIVEAGRVVGTYELSREAPGAARWWGPSELGVFSSIEEAAMNIIKRSLLGKGQT